MRSVTRAVDGLELREHSRSRTAEIHELIESVRLTLKIVCLVLAFLHRTHLLYLRAVVHAVTGRIRSSRTVNGTVM